MIFDLDHRIKLLNKFAKDFRPFIDKFKKENDLYDTDVCDLFENYLIIWRDMLIEQKEGE
jgi:hypothetical protein